MTDGNRYASKRASRKLSEEVKKGRSKKQAHSLPSHLWEMFASELPFSCHYSSHLEVCQCYQSAIEERRKRGEEKARLMFNSAFAGKSVKTLIKDMIVNHLERKPLITNSRQGIKVL